MEIRCAEDNKSFKSEKEAADFYGISQADIIRVCRKPGLTIQDKHFHFDYGEKYAQNFDQIFLHEATTRRQFTNSLIRSRKRKG